MNIRRRIRDLQRRADASRQPEYTTASFPIYRGLEDGSWRDEFTGAVYPTWDDVPKPPAAHPNGIAYMRIPWPGRLEPVD